MLCVHTLYFTSFKDVVCTDISTRMCVVSLSPMCIENKHIYTPVQSVCINNACTRTYTCSTEHLHALHRSLRQSTSRRTGVCLRRGRGLHSLLLHHDAPHLPPQPLRQAQDQQGTVAQDEQRWVWSDIPGMEVHVIYTFCF